MTNPQFYDGVIARQALVDFCRAQVASLEKDLETLQTAHARASYDDRLDFGEAIALKVGQQTSLRVVCEWAATHKEVTGKDEE